MQTILPDLPDVQVIMSTLVRDRRVIYQLARYSSNTGECLP